jgi:NhaA family Na+:H+ antiporter
MTSARPSRLTLPLDETRDHILGGPAAEFTLLEYGSYACEYCHAAHEVVTSLRRRFGDRLRYVYRHLPLTDREMATRAAELAEYAAQTGGRFWDVHQALMSRSPTFSEDDLRQLARELNLPAGDGQAKTEAVKLARKRVREDAISGLESGARVTPTFFINGRRYEGPWDESALAEAILRPPGHRIRAATVEFARWAPSTGVLLLVMTALALVLSNTAVGPAFERWWITPVGVRWGSDAFALPLIDWVNHGLLSVFFLVVGLEIKRELTVGRLAGREAATLPIAAALGGMIVPALLYLLVIRSAALAHGWGVTIATDTAFAVALIIMLGDRVPVELRVFLTAAVIVDDLVAIAVVAFFYSGSLQWEFLAAGAVVTAGLVLLNRWSVYRSLPYAALGIVLWLCLHEGGVHATLAGVILAVVTPTRPPPNLRALVAQAQTVIDADARASGDSPRREGPSEPALRALDAIHDRVESPASRLLRNIEPWSSYFVLPVFALANAGVTWSREIVEGHGRLLAAIILGLVVGKPVGITLGAWLASRLGIARKPAAYGWRQLLGAGALGGIGFTMSLFIAGQAFPTPADFRAAKIGIFIASIVAGTIGVLILRGGKGEGPRTHQPSETTDG